MEKTYFEHEAFEKIDYSKDPLPKGNYENCVFENCIFQNADLSSVHFSECTFTGCSLSMANIRQTSFVNIMFRECKLLGWHFENCNKFLFSVQFENCILNLASFYQLPLKKMHCRDCSFQEVVFAECDLSESTFENCDFSKALFEKSILEKADFRTSYNYAINPEINKIKGAKFAIAGIRGLLVQYDIKVE